MPLQLPRNRSSNGTAFYRAGRGRALLLIHGVGLRLESWCDQIESLAEGATVIAVDLPGHGESDPIGISEPHLADYTNHIKDCTDEIAGEPLVIIGHSMGAMIALDFATRFPEACRGVAALNAIYNRPAKARIAVRERAALLAGKNTADLALAPVKRWFGDTPSGAALRAAEMCTAWLSKACTSGYATAYSVFAQETGPADDALTALQAPALFLTGDRDENSTPQMSRTMANLTPDAEAVVIAGAGHLAQLTHAEQVGAQLQRLVARLDTREC